MHKDPKLPALDSGLVRHRLVLGGCFSLALICLGGSMLGLNSTLIARDAVIDTSFQTKEQSGASSTSSIRSYNFFYDLALVTGTAGCVLNSAGSNAKPSNEQNSDALHSISSKATGQKEGPVKYGFADKQGRIVIPVQFEAVGEFHADLAQASVDGRHYGYIGRSGKFVIRPEYVSAGDFRDGLALVELDNCHYKLIDAHNQTKLSAHRLEKRDCGYEAALAEYGDGKIGFLSWSGQWIIPPEFDEIAPLASVEDSKRAVQGHSTAFRYVKVRKNEKWGLYDTLGHKILPTQYENILSYQKGRACIVVDKKCTFVDRTGRIALPAVFDYATAYDDIIALKHGNRWEVVDSSFRKLPVQIDGVIIVDKGHQWLIEGMAPIIRQGLCGFLDDKGRLAIKPQFKWTDEFKNGYALVWDGAFWRFIDKTGNFASAQCYGSVNPFHDGKAEVTIPGFLYRLGRLDRIIATDSSFEERKSGFTDTKMNYESNCLPSAESW